MVRLCLVERDPNRDQCLAIKHRVKIYICKRVGLYAHRKVTLERRIPVYRLLHRVIRKLVREHDRAAAIKVARGQVGDEIRIVGVNVRGRNVVRPDAPVVRVELPYDGLKAERICNVANAVL